MGDIFHCKQHYILLWKALWSSDRSRAEDTKEEEKINFGCSGWHQVHMNFPLASVLQTPAKIFHPARQKSCLQS
jgi:hypothetical protein